MNTEQRKEWIIQKCKNAFKNDYEAWPEYDQPMTRDQMLEALEECNAKWPHLEFRGHKIATVYEFEPKG